MSRRHHWGDGSTSVRKRDGRRYAALWTRDHEGRRRRQVAYCPADDNTPRRVERELRDLIARRDRGEFSRPPAPERPTVADFLQAWLADCIARRLSANTIRTYAVAVERHLIPAFGATALGALTVDDVQRWLATPGTLGPKSLRTHLGTLRAALGWALATGRVERNVAHFAKGPKSERDERPRLTPEQARAVLVAAAGTRTQAVIALGLLGLREGECAGVQWRDIDWPANVVKVRRQVRIALAGGVELADLKTARGRRDVPLAPFAVDALVAHRDRQPSPSWGDQVFVTANGRLLWPSQIRKEWTHISRVAGIPPMGFHATRHTAASLMAEAGVPLPVMLSVLGHSTVPQTLHYSHVDGRARAAAGDALGKAMGG